MKSDDDDDRHRYHLTKPWFSILTKLHFFIPAKICSKSNLKLNILLEKNERKILEENPFKIICHLIDKFGHTLHSANAMQFLVKISFTNKKNWLSNNDSFELKSPSPSSLSSL